MSTHVFTSASRIDLAWDASVPLSDAEADQIDTYELVASDVDGNPIASWKVGAVTTYTLAPGSFPLVPFTLTVAAISKAGLVSAPSNPLSFRPATAPAAPGAFRGVVAWS